MPHELVSTELAKFYDKVRSYHCVRINRTEEGLVRPASNGSKSLQLHDADLAERLALTVYMRNSAGYQVTYTGSFGGSHAMVGVDFQLRYMDFMFRRKDLAVLFKLAHGGSYEARG